MGGRAPQLSHMSGLATTSETRLNNCNYESTTTHILNRLMILSEEDYFRTGSNSIPPNVEPSISPVVEAGLWSRWEMDLQDRPPPGN
jgi:hypothetical protein